MIVRVSSPRFVGRREELSALEAAVARAQAGDGSLVLISGESGVGKSRLIAELTTRARKAGATVMFGECLELAEGELPYAAIVAAVRSFVHGIEQSGGPPGPAGTALGLLVPELRGQGSPEAQQLTQSYLFEQLLEALSAVSREAPLLLVLEDLHWADRSTRDFIAFLIRNARRERLAVVASYRSDELHRRHPLRPFLHELERSGHAARIDLPPFDRRELLEQMTAILDREPEAALVDRVLERSEGNPFFAEELLACSDSVESSLPESLKDALLLRVEALTASAQSVVRIAAVAGRTVEHSLLAVVADLPAEALTHALREAVGRYVLVNDPSSSGYSFRHALLREAVYTDLLPGERRSLHIALAEALEEQAVATGATTTTAAELAFHWYAAHELRRALPACVRAGIDAECIHATAEALLHYERALEIWDAAGAATDDVPIDRVEVSRRAAEAANLGGDSDRAVGLIRAALKLSPDATNAVTDALIHERLGRYLWAAGRGEDALPEYARAVELMPADPPSQERAFVLAAEGQVLMLCNRSGESTMRCEEAVAIARQVGAPAVEAHALNTIAANLTNQGDPEGAVAATARARQIAAELGLVEELGRSFVNGSDALDEAGRTEQAIALALEGIEVMAGLGADRLFGDFLRGEVVGRLFRVTRWSEADELLEKLLIREPTGVTGALAYGYLGQLLAERGELDAADRALERAGELVARSGGSMWLGPHYAARVAVELWRRRPQSAAAIAAECLGLVEGAEYPFFTARLYDLAARAAADLVALAPGDANVRLRQAEGVRVLLARLDGRLEEISGLRPPIATAARQACAAELSRIESPLDPDPWVDAQRSWERVEDRYQAAYAQWRQAEALVLARGDRRAAQAAAAAAHALSVRLRARPLHDELEALARRARLQIGGADTAAEGDEGLERFELTPRELEVLTLLAGGQTNREIARELFISEKTASVHVSHILSKLGVANRAAAAALAHTSGWSARRAADHDG